MPFHVGQIVQHTATQRPYPYFVVRRVDLRGEEDLAGLRLRVSVYNAYTNTFGKAEHEMPAALFEDAGARPSAPAQQAPVDLTDYDGVEMHPIANVSLNPSEEPIYEQVDEDAPCDFWSVFLHLKAGGVECVADCKDRGEAAFLADMLEQGVAAANIMQESGPQIRAVLGETLSSLIDRTPVDTAKVSPVPEHAASLRAPEAIEVNEASVYAISAEKYRAVLELDRRLRAGMALSADEAGEWAGKLAGLVDEVVEMPPAEDGYTGERAVKP